MNFILHCVAWIIGLVAGVLFIIQPLIVLFFGIPFTLKLKRMGAIIGNGPIPTYIGSLVVMPILFCLITWGVSTWLPNNMIAYWIGVGFTVLMGLGKCGATPTNIGEYLESNSKMIDPNALEQMRSSIQSRNP